MKRFLLATFAFIALSAQAQDSLLTTEKQEVVQAAQAQETIQTPQAQEDIQVVKYGFLSYDYALKAMPEYGEVQMHLDTLRTAYQQEMQRVEKEFNSKYEDFLEGQKDFPRTILLKRQKELQEMLEKNIQFKQQLQQDLKDTEAKLLASLYSRLNETIASIAREQKLELVVNTDSNSCPFIDPKLSVDLNEQVVQLLNVKKKK